MTRKLLSLFVLISLVVAVAGVTSFANNDNRYFEKAKTDQETNSTNKMPPQTSALGSYTSDGGSPGAIIGRTWRDDQAHINPGNFIDMGTDGRVHFIYATQVAAGYNNVDVNARWLHYNMFDPTVAPGGVFVAGASGVPMQSSPLAEGGHFPQMVLDEDNHMIGAGEAYNATLGADWAPWTKIWWDISDPGFFGTFVNDTLPMDHVSDAGGLRYQQPRIDRQEYLGNYILHVVSLFSEGYEASTREMFYHRKVATPAESASGSGGTWSSMFLSDSVWSNHYDIGTSNGTTGEVSIAWVEFWNNNSSSGTFIYVMKSTDAGATWTAKEDIEQVDPLVDGWNAWIECNVMVDSDGNTHVVWNAAEYTNGSAGGIDPSRVFHWTDAVPGSVAGGTTSTVDILQNIVANVDCHGSSNMFNHAKPVISECNGRLYVVWQRFGDPDFPDDCAADSVSDGFRGAVNSDLYMNISLGLEGSLWDFRRNLTNTHTPGCDGSDANPCDHDSYPSLSREGILTSGLGTTYWSSVPEAFEVRDALDAGYPDDGYYLDVQYVNDIIADVARYMDTQHWSNNPIKWFRLPCVPPVIEPRIYVASGSFEHPNNFVPSGTEVVIDIDIENIGNDDLNITTVSASYVEGAGWLTINTPSLSLLPASAGIVTVTLNSGGAINPAPGLAVAIEGYVIFESNDPNSPRDSLYVRTVVAEDVIIPADAQIKTGLGVPLVISNNGSAGGTGFGGNLQFFEAEGIDLDCDSQSVYLYDLCPIVMLSADSGSFWWMPYAATSDVAPTVDMVPVPGGVLAETGSTGEFNQHTTGQFVTADSTIGMIKTWAAPTAVPATDVAYMVEKWQIYSFDGAAITGLSLGEWVDMDVPSDTGSNNVGTVVEADQYLYVSGQEADTEGCLASDGRFYTTGLLGHYFQSAYDADANVNNTTMSGIYVQQIEDMMPEVNGEFDPDSVWAFMNRGTFDANNSEWNDQRSFMSFGAFDIPVGDTLVIWVMHGTILSGIEADVATLNADAKVWYIDNRDDIGTFGCCGTYTGGYPGNIDFGSDGKRNLADITALIDHVYINKNPLLCDENGDVNYDTKNNLADITSLIDHVYIGKNEFDPCQ